MLPLSDEQHRIVHGALDVGHRLVLAAPGSGKTHTIVARIRHLLGDRGVEPEQVLALTFTRKAATELRERIEHPDVWVGTFHAVCADLLTQHGGSIGWEPPLRIWDERRQRETLVRALSAAGYAQPDDVRQRERFLKDLQQRISWRKRTELGVILPRPGDGLDDDLAMDVDGVYCRLLREANALDFDDLIAGGIQLLFDDPE